MRSCPYHFHYAQGGNVHHSGRQRYAGGGGEMPAGSSAGCHLHSAGPDPHQDHQHSDAPLKYLSVSTREQPELVMYPIPGKYQGDGARRRWPAGALPAAPFNLARLLAGMNPSRRPAAEI
ncbi:hypothetical protein M8494_12550 [Serratia ureilytica]